jgi:hypothetical protein
MGGRKMTTHDRDKVIAATKECFDCYEDGRGRFEYSADEYGLERFYAIAYEAGRVAEREECVQMCDNMVLYTGFDCAEAIRARGDTK